MMYKVRQLRDSKKLDQTGPEKSQYVWIKIEEITWNISQGH